MAKVISHADIKAIRYLCSKCNKLVCEEYECLFWASLPDAPEVGKTIAECVHEWVKGGGFCQVVNVKCKKCGKQESLWE
jgi:hypothetical protein